MKFNITRTQIILAVPLIIASISIIVLAARFIFPDHPVITGIVETTQVDVASKISGRIDSVFVKEGDMIIRGQVLATLESKEMDPKVGQARSAMEGARQKMEMALHGARKEEKEAVQNQYKQAQAQFDLASKTWSRVERVYRDSLVSTQEHDQVEFQYKAAKEQMDAARAKYEMVMNGARSEEIAGAIALFHQAENVYIEALAYQKELRLVSPIDGEVSKIIVDAGEIVAGGYPVFTITKPADVWVVLQVKEDQMKSIKLGAKFRGHVRAIEQSEQEFEVSYIAAMADFATWKPTNQKGDFDVKSFEIHLRSTIPVPNLRAGMTVNISL